MLRSWPRNNQDLEPSKQELENPILIIGFKNRPSGKIVWHVEGAAWMLVGLVHLGRGASSVRWGSRSRFVLQGEDLSTCFVILLWLFLAWGWPVLKTHSNHFSLTAVAVSATRHLRLHFYQLNHILSRGVHSKRICAGLPAPTKLTVHLF